MRISDWSSDVCSSDLGRALEKRLDHDRAFWKRAVSVAVMEVLRLPAFHPAIPQDDRAFDEDISGLPAIRARVHADCAAGRSGNAPQNSHPGTARVPRSARAADPPGRAPGTDAVSRLGPTPHPGTWQPHTPPRPPP